MRSTNMQKPYGRLLRSMREFRGMSISTLADLAATQKGYISEIERGTKDNPSLDWLERIAQALNITVDYFTGTSYISVDEAAHIESLKLYCKTHQVPRSASQVLQSVFLDVRVFSTVEAWKGAHESLRTLKELGKARYTRRSQLSFLE